MKNIVAQLPTVQEIVSQYPLPASLAETKYVFDQTIKDNLVSQDKYVIVVGPCSADNYDSMVEYLTQLQELANAVKDKIIIVARIYTAKPRTDGNGYLGLLFNQQQNDPIDFLSGIINCRKLMIKCLELGLPIADEMLYPFALPYMQDLVSYYFLGARSSLDPLHRDYCSGLDVAVGVKNAIDGDIVAVAKSVQAISSSKTLVDNNNIITTSGNCNCHIVLRGSHNGESFVSNYDKNTTSKVVSICKEMGLANCFVMVDCSHANSGKVARVQIDVAKQVIEDSNVSGIMLESYINSGVSHCQYGVSKTDDCLDFDSTRQLILDIFDQL